MLKLVPKSSFSWDFHVLEDGREVAFIDRTWFGENAGFTIDDKVYEVRRTSLLQGRFVLEGDGKVLAEARKTSPLRRRFQVSVGPDTYTLESTRALRREFTLLLGGVPVGGVRPASVFRRSATANFPVRVSRPVQLFLVFLVLVLWKRAADSS